jgi:hypothetical protein
MAVTGEEHLGFADAVTSPMFDSLLFYAKELERALNSLPQALRTPVDGAEDPQLTTRLHNYSVGGTAGAVRFYTGTVVFSVPTSNCCRVLLGNGQAERWCVPLMQSSSSPLSPIDVALPSPNSQVLVAVAGEAGFGYILGCVPPRTVDAAGELSDYLLQGTSVGAAKEATYRSLIENCLREAGVRDYSSHRPMDQTASVWAKLSSLGLGVFVDLLMTGMRVDERCGIWFHYLNNLTRLAGTNLDVWTGGTREFVRVDRSEVVRVSGITPYAWEALGKLTSGGVEVSQRNNVADVQTAGNDGDREPKDAKVRPFYRYREYGGYLGQGFVNELVAPGELDGTYTDASPPDVVLFREQLSLAGDHAVLSARGLSWLKRTALTSPRQVRMPEDPQGDTAEDYRSAGVSGSGDRHVPPVANRQLSAIDTVARVSNWDSVWPFHYHKKDFDTPEPAELPHVACRALPFADLQTRAKMTAMTPVSTVVDAQQTVDVYETVSGDTIDPDGTRRIIGPAGQTIILGTDGHIIFDCPGDILLKSGRTTAILAGDDVVLRAYNSVDVTSAHKDVRLKAERNMELLAGNSGTGHLLLESRSEDLLNYTPDMLGETVEGSGIVLRAANSRLAAYTAGIYLRTGGRDSGLASGDIILDAGKGENDIITIANEQQHRLTSAVSFSFPAVDDETQTTHTLTQSDLTISGTLSLSDKLTVAENGIDVGGDIRVKAGHILTERAGDAEYQGKVGSFVPGSADLTQLGALLTDVTDAAATAARDAETYYSENIKPLYEVVDDGTPIGSADMIAARAFSLRNEQQYGTDELLLTEAHWQQLHRSATDGEASVWDEPAVSYRSSVCGPWPGRERWNDSSLLEIDAEIHDPATGRDAARSTGKYEKTDKATSRTVAPNTAYRIMPHE